MEIRTTYIGTLDGVAGVWCGFKPENAIIREERQVLYPDNKKILVRISDGEQLNSIWLRDGDIKTNYIEIKIKEEQIEESEGE